MRLINAAARAISIESNQWKDAVQERPRSVEEHSAVKRHGAMVKTRRMKKRNAIEIIPKEWVSNSSVTKKRGKVEQIRMRHSVAVMRPKH
jgi:hypothetical protein